MHLKHFVAAMVILLQTTFCVRAQEAYAYDCFFDVPTYGNEVNSIYRDPISGIVWLGTEQGLFRYGNMPLNKESQAIHPDLLTQSIKSVQGMKDGSLLLRSVSRQYLLYNPLTNKIEYNFNDIAYQWGLRDIHSWESEIIIGGDDDFWIYSGNRLWCYDPEVSPTAVLKVKAENAILTVCIGTDNVYVLTSTSLSAYDKRTSSLLFKVDSFPLNDVRNIKMVEDKYGNIWVGNTDLYRYVLRKACWENMIRKLFVTDMAKGPDGDIYVASSSRGIIHYNSVEDKLENIIGNPLVSGSLKNNRLHSIFVDAEDNLWVSYSKQNFAIGNRDLKYFQVRHIESLKRRNIDDDIISLAYDPNGILWMGTDGNGLYNTVSADGRNVLPDRFSQKDNSQEAVTALYVDSFGRLWVGLYQGGLLCKTGNNWNTFLDGMSPYSIVENSQGEIYVGLLGDGVYCIHPESERTPLKVDTKGRQYVMQLFCDESDTLYVATSSGLQLIDTHSGTSRPESSERIELFEKCNIQSIYKDSRGLLWLITSHDKTTLRVFDRKTDSLMSVEGLENKLFRSIIEDNEHNMWGVADNEIVNIKVSQDTLGNYRFNAFFYILRSNEEFNGYNYRSVAKLPDGTLVFGSINGYRYVDPLVYENLRINENLHEVHLASLKVNNEVIEIGKPFHDRKILEQDISVTKSISLAHDENNLTFTLHSQDYATPFETQYYYRLAGLEESWTLVENNIISLSNLLPGDYELEIGARNFNGTMTAVLASLHIKIAAQWYMTPAAYLFYFVIGFSLIFLIALYFAERQRQHLRLNQAEKEIERQHQLSEMKLRFFTNISHDLRTPLTLIITPLEAYLSNKGGNSDVKFFMPIYKNAVRLLNLINQILDFRKLEVYGVSLNPSTGDIVAFVREICSSFTLYAEDTDTKLEFLSSEDCYNMMFDKDKLEKIVMNLLSNAFKHTPNGGKVCVKMVKLDKSMQISVIDNGCGIPDDEKQAVFHRFYQKKCDNAANMGCGIGLHIVKEFVNLHHGSIEVKDNCPTGAIFTVTLPITTMSDIQQGGSLMEKTISRDEKAVDADNSHNPMITILLVEDNDEFLNFLSGALASDYHILCASNGVKALKIIESNYIDLIVSDVMMDEMDGLRLCGLIKNDLRYSHIPIILLTAKAMVEDEIQGLEVGADDYITKPFNLSILKLRIHNLLKDRESSYMKFKTKVEINPSEIAITSLDEQFISRAIAVVEENMANPDFSVEDLSKRLGLHRTHLYRKLYGITGTPPVEFIRLIRLKRACQYLEKGHMYIAEIAYAVGFNSPKLFSKYFKQEFKVTPKEYMKHVGRTEV